MLLYLKIENFTFSTKLRAFIKGQPWMDYQMSGWLSDSKGCVMDKTGTSASFKIYSV